MRERGDFSLFPFGELEDIRSRFSYIDLFKSLDDVRRTIDRKSPATTPVQGIVEQPQGTTAQGQPLATPAAGPSTGPIAGLSKTAAQRLKERDPLAVDVLEGTIT